MIQRNFRADSNISATRGRAEFFNSVDPTEISAKALAMPVMRESRTAPSDGARGGRGAHEGPINTAEKASFIRCRVHLLAGSPQNFRLCLDVSLCL